MAPDYQAMMLFLRREYAASETCFIWGYIGKWECWNWWQKHQLPRIQTFRATGIFCESKEYQLAVILICNWIQRMNDIQARQRNLCVYSNNPLGTSIKELYTAVESYRGQAFLSIQKSAHYLGCPGLASSKKSCLSPLPSSAARAGAAKSSWEAHHSSSD